MKPLTLAACLLFLATASPAQPVTEAEARELLLRLHEEGQRGAFATPALIEYERIFTFKPTQQELTKLQKEIEGRPEHPKRSLEPVWSQAARNSFKQDQVRAWLGDRLLFRYAQNPAEVDPRYHPQFMMDFASGPDGAWHLNPRAVLREDSEVPLNRSRARSKRDGELGFVLFGATIHASDSPFALLQLQQSSKLDPGCVTVSEDPMSPGRTARWIWTIGRHETGDPVLLRAVVDPSVEVAETLPTTFEYTNFVWSDVASRLVARRVTGFLANGRENRQYLISSITPVSIQEVREVASLPTASRPDPVRGWAGQQTVELPTPEQMGRVLAPGIVLPPAEEPHRSGWWPTAVIALVSAGLVFAALRARSMWFRSV